MVETSKDKEVFFEADATVTLLAAASPDPPVLAFTVPALPLIEKKPLRFVSREAPALRAVPAATPRPRARRWTLSRSFDLAVIALMVVCAAACVYRIFWAMQP